MSGNPIDRLFDALTQGDVAAAADAFAPDARIWHSYDGVAFSPEEMVPQWEGLVAGTAARRVTDVRRQATENGFVQQHLFVMETAAGAKAWPVCVVVHVAKDRIARLDEYIDRAGSFAVDGSAPTTPGL